MKNSSQNKLKCYSLPKNNIIKTIIYKNKINKTKKNKNKENFSNNTSSIINTFENEKDYIKGKDNTTIVYENNNEIIDSNKYPIKENLNNSINKKKTSTNLINERIRHEIINKRNNNKISNSNIDVKKNQKKDMKENKNSNNEKLINRKKNTISNISIYMNNSKPKYVDNIDEYKNKVNNRISSNSINKLKNSSTKLIIKNK